MTLLQLIQIFLAAGVVAPVVQQAGNLDTLRRVATAEAAEYLRVRQDVLAHSHAQWNIAEAAAESWEIGVAAFVLNARRVSPESFQRMDAVQPRRDITGRSYTLPEPSVENRVAFLLEKAWKPVEEGDRARGLSDLRLGLRKGTGRVADPAMWRAIWEECPIERLREISLFLLASSSDLAVLGIVAGVMAEHGDAGTKRLQALCLTGLLDSELPEAGELVLTQWEYLRQEQTLAEKALAVFGANVSERARSFVHGLALDEDQEEWLRARAAVSCCLRPHPGDPAMFRKFLAGPGSIKMKAKVLKGMQGRNGYPLDPLRPVLREIIITSDDEELTESAALTLTSCYRHAKDVN
ncbi:MAG: hypothetical protein JSU86_08460, partial [Phycisphaerales bacterium]